MKTSWENKVTKNKKSLKIRKSNILFFYTDKSSKIKMKETKKNWQEKSSRHRRDSKGQREMKGSFFTCIHASTYNTHTSATHNYI